MTATASPPPPPVRRGRSKASQIVDIISKCTSEQVAELAHTWEEREPEHLSRFCRELASIPAKPVVPLRPVIKA